jgi:hypothetical protein
MARLFSASISAAARARIRSSSSRVAAMSASRPSLETRWARSMISRASRRAAASCSAATMDACSRSRRACSASLRPCSILARRSSSVFVTGFQAKIVRITRNRTKFVEATRIQNRLSWIPAPPSSAATAAAAAAIAGPAA